MRGPPLPTAAYGKSVRRVVSPPAAEAAETAQGLRVSTTASEWTEDAQGCRWKGGISGGSEVLEKRRR